MVLQGTLCQSEKWQKQLNDLWLCHGYAFTKNVLIIGLKAPGNSLDQFSSDEILVLLCEGTKPPNSMIYGSSAPGTPYLLI